MNSNQSESIRAWIDPNRIFNPKLIGIIPTSDSFGLILIGNLVRIASDQVGLIFYCFVSNEIQHVFQIGWELLEMVPKQIPE